MNDELASRVERSRADYERVVGRPFAHFFCPILFGDYAGELCLGHVINEAFAGSSRRTAVQRSDVDSFFGSRFEADFVLLQEKGSQTSIDILLDPSLSRRMRPRLIRDGKVVDHYFPRGEVPKEHSELFVDRGSLPPVRLALKLEPNETLDALDSHWEVLIDKDIRLHVLVSLLKAAHLTLFSMMGYSYALTASGRFLGWDVLGQFAAANLSFDKPTVLANAIKHFGEFVNLVRPMLVSPDYIDGTVSDNQLFLCTGTPKAWAFLVFVRTGEAMHAVIVPILEEPEGAARFASFLKATSGRFEVKRAKFHRDRWEVAKDGKIIEWPEARFSDPAV